MKILKLKMFIFALYAVTTLAIKYQIRPQNIKVGATPID